MSLSAAVVAESIRPYKVTLTNQSTEWGLGYSGQEWWASGSIGNMRRSTDGGLTWIAPAVAHPFAAGVYCGTGPGAGGDVWTKNSLTGNLGWLWDYSAGAWVASNLPASVTFTGHIAHGAGRFVCAGSTGQMYYSDTAGTTWTAGTNIGGYPQISFDTVSGYFYAANGNTNGLYYSIDGITWTAGAPAVGGAVQTQLGRTSHGKHFVRGVWPTSGFGGPWYNSSAPPSGAYTRLDLTPYVTDANSGIQPPPCHMWAGTHYFFPKFNSYSGIGWECDSSFANWRLIDIQSGNGLSISAQQPFSGAAVSESAVTVIGSASVQKFT